MKDSEAVNLYLELMEIISHVGFSSQRMCKPLINEELKYYWWVYRKQAVRLSSALKIESKHWNLFGEITDWFRL